jgi:hypothetical protein
MEAELLYCDDFLSLFLEFILTRRKIDFGMFFTIFAEILIALWKAGFNFAIILKR